MSFSWARPYDPKHPLMRWFDERLPLPRVMYGAVLDASMGLGLAPAMFRPAAR